MVHLPDFKYKRRGMFIHGLILLNLIKNNFSSINQIINFQQQSLQFNVQSMQAQKRIKTLGCDIRQASEKKQKKQKHDKSSIGFKNHKDSEVHLKSISKDITPKKHSITIQKSKFKQNGTSNKKMYKSKQLTSMCSYSGIQKQSIPVTKRKGSNAHSVKKKKSKNKQQIHESLKSTVSNFSILTKCLTQYIKEEKKKGKDPSKQILQLIKAFNKSQVAPLSKQLQILISNMLDYIEDTVGLPQSREPSMNQGEGIKSRTSFSSASDEEVAYSQILESQMPSTIKKQLLNKNESSVIQYMGKQQLNQIIEQRKENSKIKKNLKSNWYNYSVQKEDKSEKKITKELEKELKKDLKNMHDQLYHLKSAGEKLQNKAESQTEDKKKLQQMYIKNKRLLDNMVNKTEILKVNPSKSQQIQFHEDLSEDDDYE